MFFQALMLFAASRLCAGEIWMAPNKLSSAEIEEILKLHNDYRATVGASNMIELKWDPALADLAQGHVERCEWHHANLELPDGRQAGQNLAASTDNFSLRDGFNGWIGEIIFENLTTLECEGGWHKCGHLTQVLNARTQWIGCAIKTDCPDKWKIQIVCDYFPQQAADVATFEHGPACFDCFGATCTSGLCSCGNPPCIHGELDLDTCTCGCFPPYGGPACDEETGCRGPDHEKCGGRILEISRILKYSDIRLFCETFDNTRLLCPHMCGLC